MDALNNVVVHVIKLVVQPVREHAKDALEDVSKTVQAELLFSK